VPSLHDSALAQAPVLGTAGLGGPAPAIPGYEMLGVLGGGGMGVVYQARHLKLNRLVALKVIRAGSLASATALVRFRHEAEAVARLQHPHVVQIYEIGEHEGLPYLALEFVEGGSLAQRINGTPLPPQQAAQLLELLAGAIHFAHERNLIHRDLKPANVLLTADGTPKITDFGLAKSLDSGAGETASGEILGTPSYMPPEQADSKGRPIGRAADVYALGAILYELLTGRPPFKAASVLETVAQVIADEPVPPRQLQLRTPRDLETICLKCLRKEPRQRYGSAAELAEDLRRFHHGEPIQARPVGHLERLGRWCRRNPRVAALLAVLALVVLGGTTAITGLWLLADERRRVAEDNAGKTERQKQRAEAYLQNARAAVDKLAKVAAESLANVPHMEKLRRQVLQEALSFNEGFLKEKSDDPEVRLEASWTHSRLAAIYLLLGQQRDAVASYGRAIELQEKLAGEFPDRPAYRHYLANNCVGLGKTLAHADPKEAEKVLTRGLSLANELVDRYPDERDYKNGMATLYNEWGNLLSGAGRTKEGDAAMVKARDAWRVLAEAYPDVASYQHTLAGTLDNLAHPLIKANQELPRARQLVEQAIFHEKEALRLEPENALSRFNLAVHFQALGATLKRLKDYDGAEKAYRDSIAVRERLMKDYPAIPNHPSALGGSLNDLCYFLIGRGRLTEARACVDQAIVHQKAALAVNAGNLRYRQFLSNHYWNLTDVLVRQEDYLGAVMAVEQMVGAAPNPKVELHDGAWHLGRCVLLVEKDSKLTEAKRKELAKTYGDQAMQWLQEGLKKGYKDTAALEKDAEFSPLRGREDFKKLLAAKVPAKPNAK
jgi:tetratricopeptide (TPR) repeat protein